MCGRITTQMRLATILSTPPSHMWCLSQNRETMTTEEEIMVNQVAQRILPWQTGLDWFQTLPAERKLSVLKDLGYMVCQAGALVEDVSEACHRTGLRGTYTP